MDALNPCRNCGACCARYLVAFYWAEGNDATPGGVPVALTERYGPWRRIMLGTNQRPPRCAALQGTIGERVCCTIYAGRPSICRRLIPAWVYPDPYSLCNEARSVHGLPSFS